MRTRVKAAIAIVIILAITIPTIFIVMNLLGPQEQEPFNLDNAPKYIKESKSELKGKLLSDNFTLDDIPKFVTLMQYIADNSPEVHDLVVDWNAVILIDLGEPEYLWFIVADDSLSIFFGDDPPTDYTIDVSLNLDTFILIMTQEESPLSAWQAGLLNFDGPFNEVLTFSQIVNIASATMMDLPPSIDTTGPNISISVDHPDSYIEGGMTLVPLIDITIVPDRIGEHHASIVGPGRVVILDRFGSIVAERDQSSHTVHKFLNSTTIIMGGQEGDMQLWNYKTDKLVTLNVPAGHHELDYNPETNTFMVLEYVFGNETYNGDYVIYDFISEYDMNGALVWQWDPRIYFPFNATREALVGLNETFRGGADWMHSNSFAWDKENGFIYLNVRSQDTILKIDYNTKQVIWDAGRNGDFTLINSTGQKVDSLFYHSHSLEWIGNNRFIIFDNDLYDPAKMTVMDLNHAVGVSKFMELEIDEENKTMREVWSWGLDDPDYYFPESGGDADRLPDGNTLGIFGDKGLVLNIPDPVILTEVTRAGEIAWEMRIDGTNNSYYWAQRVERFYEKPIIQVNHKSVDVEAGTLHLNISTWNTYKEFAYSSGTVRVLGDGVELYSEDFDFLPQWQPTVLNINLDNIPAGISRIEVVVENADGLVRSVLIYGQPISNLLPIIALVAALAGIIIIIPVVYYLRKRGKLGGTTPVIQETQ
jgi:hypothetical protein